MVADHKAVLPSSKDIYGAQDLATLRSLSFDERGRLIELACRAAAEILIGRRRSGLPDEEPAPWPASTFELLKKYARDHAQRKT
jgi:hypothetical protein